jgi:hypothetical protein
MTPSRVGTPHDPTWSVGVGITRGLLADRADDPHATHAIAATITSGFCELDIARPTYIESAKDSCAVAEMRLHRGACL